MKNSSFANYIIRWYRLNKRDLPWRDTQDPYKIWLSEIILQQTRVKQGLPYFERFVAAYPDVFALARASEEEVLRLWQGLGYYSRARNLHACAREIVNQYNGNFPESYHGLLKLKGVGNYTAAAVASFAYNETVAVVDGNVYRVLARVFGVKKDILSTEGQKTFKELADELVPEGQAGEYNQAIMEFGALQCTPQNPKCLLCPLSGQCHAFQHNAQRELPVKIRKVKVKKRFFSYIVIRQGKYLYMKLRRQKDIWQGLYDFHLLETRQAMEDPSQIDDTLLSNALRTGATVEMSNLYRHQLTHQQLWVRFFLLDVRKDSMANSLLNSQELQAYSLEEVRKLPKPILVDNYLSEVIF
mgnify:FL=1